MLDWLSASQQTTLLIILGLALLIVLLRLLLRIVRRALGRQSIIRAQGQAVNNQAEAGLPMPWQALRGEVEMANRVLDRRVFEHVQQVFLDHYAQGRITPAALTPEFAREEFLLVVDEQGQPAKPDRDVLERFQKTAAAHPAFRSWFHEETIQDGLWAGVRTLTAARWLCHLIGLRHTTVEIFIDLPDRPGYTLIQVRAMHKYDSPGGFDMPCAGHVTGMLKPQAALEQELLEELGLELVDLCELRLLDSYNAYGDAGEGYPAEGAAVPPSSRFNLNNEHRLLYRAILKPESAAAVHFADGEVAGLSIFLVSELRALIREYPERVASGLSDAIGYYD